MKILCWVGLHLWGNAWAVSPQKYYSMDNPHLPYGIGAVECRRCGKTVDEWWTIRLLLLKDILTGRNEVK
jgi:hypothetical protein